MLKPILAQTQISCKSCELRFVVGVVLLASDHLGELFLGPQRNCLFISFTGSIWPTAWRWTADGKRQTGLGALSGTVMGISCVTTETVLVLLAEAGLNWHTVPFHHFHLDCFSTLLPPLPCQAASSSQPTHLSDISLTSANRNVCSQEAQAQSATLFRAGVDV